jgi:YaiO family outer membrane protein
VDAYPKLGKKSYLYLNFGVAEESFFPTRRYGAEIFFTLPKHFEASGGLRRLEFDDHVVHILTGSVGYYKGNYYYAARPYITNKPGDTGVSLSLMMRRYFATRYDYWTVRVSGGQGSDTDQTIDELILSNHYAATFEWQHLLSKVWIFEARTGLERREYETGTTRDGWLVGVGLSRLF